MDSIIRLFILITNGPVQENRSHTSTELRLMEFGPCKSCETFRTKIFNRFIYLSSDVDFRTWNGHRFLFDISATRTKFIRLVKRSLLIPDDATYDECSLVSL